MNFTQNLTLDLNANNAYPVVSAKQGDSARYLNIYLTKDNIPYHIDESHQFYFRMRKPDGHGVLNPATVSFVRIQDEDINTTNSYVKVQLTEQILAVAGRGYADLVEYDNNGNVLSSVAFIVNVMAAPSIMNEVVSSAEFKELTELVTEANSLIIESEKWARGTEHGVPADSEYEEVKLQSQSEFDQIKDFLYIKNGDEYELVTSDTFDPNATYYTLTAGMENNSRYYSKQAENAWSNLVNVGATASAITASDTQAVANVTYSSQSNSFDFTFELPAGAQGERGPSVVWCGDTAPSDPNYLIWLKPNAVPDDYIITANQVSFDSEFGYNENTVGYTIKNIQEDNEDFNTRIAAVESKSEQLDEAVQDAKDAADEAEEALGQMENKMSIPDFGSTENWSGYLFAASPTVDSIMWKEQISYEDLSSLPKINDVELKGTKSFDDLNFKTWSSNNLEVANLKLNDGITYTQLAPAVRNMIQLNNHAVREIVVDNVRYEPDGGLVVIDNVLVENDILNKNYLDNAHFGINQRNQRHLNPYVDGEYINLSGKYICDRWKVITDQEETGRHVINGPYEDVTNQCLYISTPRYQPNPDFLAKKFSVGQVIDDDAWKELSGMDITISIDYILNQQSFFFKINCTCPEYHVDSDDDESWLIPSRYEDGEAVIPSAGWGITLKSLNNQLILEIVWSTSIWDDPHDIYYPLEIYGVKLEKGIHSTIYKESIVPSHEDLEQCQKYLRIYGNKTAEEHNPENIDVVLGFGMARSSTVIDFSLPDLGTMKSGFSVRMPENITLRARRGIKAVSTNNNDVAIPASTLQEFSKATVTSGTFSNDNYYLYDSTLNTYTVASAFDSASQSSYYRKTYSYPGIGSTLYATVECSGAASSVPYFLVLPRTVASTDTAIAETTSYIEFNAEL